MNIVKTALMLKISQTNLHKKVKKAEEWDNHSYQWCGD